MKALVKVGYGCNEHCSFCHTREIRHVEGSTEEIDRKIDRAAALGHTMVVLSGGEPTIRPELQRWAARIAARGLDVGLVTNGLVLAYPEVVQRLLASRLRYVYLSLHGGEARIHDRLVRADAFSAACTALDNLTGRGLHLTINCVVTRHNVEHLIALVDRARAWPDATVKLSAVEPKGGALRMFDALVPPIADAAARVCEAIHRGRARGQRVVHGGFPLCLMPGLHDAYDDLRTHGFRTMVEVGEPDFFPVDDDNKLQPAEPCAGCPLSGPCPGLFREYAARHGTAELRRPADAPRGNSFDWVYEALVPAPGGDCPIRADGPTPWDRARDLLVRHDGRVARYRADTRDVSDTAMATIKHALGQVYLDASRKPAPDDFPRDLVKLVRSDECRGCPHEAACTGLFEPVFEDWFSRDDARVREILAALRGDVLDVGCGEGPYDDVLAPLARAGAIAWQGIDPDPGSAEAAAQRRPWGRVTVGAVESIDLHGRRFDHVLVLRSWNHLADPELALTRLAASLRAGGTLTVVDNVAFGLARTPAASRRARASALPLHHHRNDDAEAADRRIAATGAFDRLQRRDVGPTTSNQWLLRYERRREDPECAGR